MNVLYLTSDVLSLSCRNWLSSFIHPESSIEPSGIGRVCKKTLLMLGGSSEGETPVPIPTTEVKPLSADGS